MRRRRGLLLHETSVAILIVMFVIAGASQMLYQVSKQRRAAEQRAIATLEVANLMEELASRSWSEIADQTPKLEISQASRSRLPDAQLHLEIATEENNSNARRIAVAIDWLVHDSRRSMPVRLVSWRYPPMEVKP